MARDGHDRTKRLDGSESELQRTGFLLLAVDVVSLVLFRQSHGFRVDPGELLV